MRGESQVSKPLGRSLRAMMDPQEKSATTSETAENNPHMETREASTQLAQCIGLREGDGGAPVERHCVCLMTVD
jgi:hypothetical protein